MYAVDTVDTVDYGMRRRRIDLSSVVIEGAESAVGRSIFPTKDSIKWDHFSGYHRTRKTSLPAPVSSVFSIFDVGPCYFLTPTPYPLPSEPMELRHGEEDVHSLTTLYLSLYQDTMHSLPTPLNFPPLLVHHDLVGLHASTDNVIASNKDSDRNNDAGKRTAIQLNEELDYFRERVDSLQDVMIKFRKRLTTRDPITDKPRYGEQTSQRVTVLLEQYQELCRVCELIFQPSNSQTVANSTEIAGSQNIFDTIRQLAAKEAELDERRKENERLQAIAEAESHLTATKILRQEKEEADAAVARQTQELADAIAQEAVRARRAAQAELDQAVEADRAWVRSIPNRKTLEGVQEQLVIFSENSNMDSLTALHTIFSQITAHPEEVNFRRIRRDHPRFQQDIGQFNGGKELLLAAGFDLGVVEEVPSYVCKEPDVEKDLEGWSVWFSLLKGTLELIEQQMIK